MRRAERVLALSYYTARRLKEIEPRAASQIHTMLYPIDVTWFKPNPRQQENPAYGRYLLFTARINDPRKNVAMLLQAFARVRQQHPDLKLVLAGEQPNEALTTLTRELGLAESVLYPGSLMPRSEELLRLYQGATLFVLPSAQEGLGISVLEALACGTPVVATPCGGPEGVVVEGQTGLIVSDLNDPEVFAAGILQLLADQTALSDLRTSCVKFAHEHFAPPVAAGILKDACEVVTTAHPRPGKLAASLAAFWAVFITLMYVIRQLSLRWSSIQQNLIEPLLARLS